MDQPMSFRTTSQRRPKNFQIVARSENYAHWQSLRNSQMRLMRALLCNQNCQGIAPRMRPLVPDPRELLQNRPRPTSPVLRQLPLRARPVSQRGSLLLNDVRQMLHGLRRPRPWQAPVRNEAIPQRHRQTASGEVQGPSVRAPGRGQSAQSFE